MAQQTVTWTEPALCHYNYDMTKPWFVYFDFTDTILNKTVRKQFRNGINYEKRKDQRIRIGNALISHLNDKLEEGWNPLRKDDNNPIDVPSTISDAITRVMAIKHSSLKVKSRRNYADISGMFLKWAERYGYDKYPLHKFSHKIAQAYMDYLLTERNYSGKSHNGQLGILKAFCSSMVGRWKEVIKENPFTGIDLLPEAVGKNVAYTDDEARALMLYYKARDIRVYYAANIMFHCYIRKTELSELKVGDINWQSGTITINSDSAKNRKQESVTIPDGLYPILEEMNLRSFPPNYYIFGHLMETTRQKISKPDIISNRHLAAVKDVRALTSEKDTKWGKKVAKQFMFENEESYTILTRLSDEKTFYSWKHTGVVMYWHVVKDVYYMMRQLRHSDMKTTMVYLKSLGLMPNEAFRNAKISLG